MNDYVGYGNHSCHDCKENSVCPISDYSLTPNGCSFYNPPSAKWVMPERMRKMLERIAQERIAIGLNPHVWTSRDE
jgi:hypothetical protein